MRSTIVAWVLFLCHFGPLVPVARAQYPYARIPVAGRDALTRALDARRTAAVRALLEDRTGDLERACDTAVVDTARRRPVLRPVLDPQERSLVLFHTANYARLLMDIDSSMHGYVVPARPGSEHPGAVASRGSVSLSHGIRERWRFEADRRLGHIASAVPDTADRLLLSAYWMRTIDDLLAFPQDAPFPNEDVNAKVRAYARLSTDSGRVEFALRYLMRKRRPERMFWGMDLGYGVLGPLGSAYPLVSSGTLARLNVEFSYLRFVGGVFFSTARATIERPFLLDSTTTLVGEWMEQGALGVNVGCTVYEQGRLRLIPTAGFALNAFTYNAEDGRRDAAREEIFTSRAELVVDIRMNTPVADVRSIGPHGWWDGMPEMRPFIRLRLGWQPETPADAPILRAGSCYFTVGAGLRIANTKRVRY